MKKAIATILALTMLLGLSACGKELTATPDETTQETTTPAETTAATTEETSGETTEETTADTTDDGSGKVGPADELQDYWYEIDREQGDYTDGAGNDTHYSYAIPAFNLDSADASSMNDEIAALCNRFIVDMKQSMEGASSLMTYSVDYEAWLNGDIATILVIVQGDAGLWQYGAFNLNVATGSRATGAELVAVVGMTEESFVEAAQNAVTAQFESIYGSEPSEDFREIYEEQYAKTMSADAFGLHMPMYLGQDGKLYIVATVYAMAGAESYDYLLAVN